MEFHRGRLFDHIHVKVCDLEASRRFYRAAFETLGIPLGGERPGAFWTDEFYVSAEEPLTAHIHLAF
ncbi:MAG TPA: hypothetical protein VD972_43440 [Hyalangium sp.]|nr:hypothetical protein [Hyalangium sp.]